MALAIGIAVFMFMDLIVVTTLIRAFILPLNDLAAEFPAREPAPGAVRRNFQSFSFGVFNAGWGIHVAVDEGHLHLSPALFERLFRMKAMSLPWDRVRLVTRGKRNTKVVVEGSKTRADIKGPNWCLELAS